MIPETHPPRLQNSRGTGRRRDHNDIGSAGTTRCLTPCLAFLALVASCGGAEPLPEVSRFRHQRLTHGLSAVPWPATLEGRHFRSSTREPLGFELLRVEPPYPRVRIALRHLTVKSSTQAQAEIPPGAPAGIYRLVVRRGHRWRLAPQSVRVQDRSVNSGPSEPRDLRVRRPASGEGGRLMVSGANLNDPALLTLHGPHRRQTSIRPEVKRLDENRAAARKEHPPKETDAAPDEKSSPRPAESAHADHGHQDIPSTGGHVHGPGCGHDHDEDPATRAKRAADAVGDSPEPIFARMPITELPTLHSVHGTRVLARLPQTLAAGRYYVQVFTSSHRGNAPSHVIEVTPAGRGHPKLGHVLWLGLLLVGCALGTLVLRRPAKTRGLGTLAVLVLAALCLAPLGLLV